jgi:8-oxo-dGTP pyrophosphatase MutT (NUDIX family)
MIIGCISLIHMNEGIVGIQCKKGRGIILPGGRAEAGEDFKQAAARELMEEVGLTAMYQELIFHGPPDEVSYTYCFLTEVKSYTPTGNPEHEIVSASWADLFKSRYHAFYKLLYEEVKK